MIMKWRYIIKFIKIILGIIVSLPCIVLLKILYVQIKLPYENGRFFDAETGVIYHEQAILGYFVYLLIYLFFVLLLFFINKIIAIVQVLD